MLPLCTAPSSPGEPCPLSLPPDMALLSLSSTPVPGVPISVPNKASSLGGSLGTLCSCGLSLPSGQSHYGRAGGRDSGPCVSQGPAYVGLWMGVVSISLFALPVTMWDLCPVSELRELEAPVHADLGANVGLVPDLRNQATISIK